MKKIVLLSALALCLALCLTLPALAEESTEEPALESEGFRYRLLEDGTAEILKYTGSELQLVIPETLDGRPVTAIGDEAFYNFGYSMEDLVIPASVTRIGADAFAMTDLEEIQEKPAAAAEFTAEGVAIILSIDPEDLEEIVKLHYPGAV